MKSKDLYVKNTAAILEESGLFLITSCNWTKVGERDLVGKSGTSLRGMGDIADAMGGGGVNGFYS